MGKVFVGVILIVSVLVISISLICFWYFQTKNIRNTVLRQLEKELKFCSITKDNINSFLDIGNFWLICNGRPFYVEYKNRDASYELNGWGFLKEEQSIWNDLRSCEYYDTKDSKLIFYCPKDFDSQKITAKIYQFNKDSLQMSKIEETDFLEILANDIRSVYSFLANCNLQNFTSLKSGNYPVVIWLIFACTDGDYIIGTDLSTVPLQPPIFANTNFSYEQRARISFEKSFNCNATNVNTKGSSITVTSNCYGNVISVEYMFSGLSVIYSICGETKCVKKFTKYFILPPIQQAEIELIKESEQKKVFKIGDDIVIAQILGQNIVSFWRNKEGFINE